MNTDVSNEAPTLAEPPKEVPIEPPKEVLKNPHTLIRYFNKIRPKILEILTRPEKDYETFDILDTPKTSINKQHRFTIRKPAYSSMLIIIHTPTCILRSTSACGDDGPCPSIQAVSARGSADQDRGWGRDQGRREGERVRRQEGTLAAYLVDPARLSVVGRYPRYDKVQITCKKHRQQLLQNTCKYVVI